MKRKIWPRGVFLVFLGLTLACFLGGCSTPVKWENLHAQGFRFSYPSNWNFVTKDAAGDEYVLYMPGETNGTNIIVIRDTRVYSDLVGLEQKLFGEVKESTLILRELLELEYFLLDRRHAIRLHARMTLAANGQDMESLQVAALLSDGQAVIVHLRIFNEEDSEVAVEVFEKIINSLKFHE